MKLLLGTESPLKRKAIEVILQEFTQKELLKEEINIIPKKVNQHLPITPYNDDTFHFAKERVEILLHKFIKEGDLFIGIESGLIERYGVWFEECWCIIADIHRQFYYGYSSGLSLPSHIVERMKKGEKHHDIVNDIALGNPQKETWSIYTNGAILRQKSIEESFRNAFYYAIKQ